MTFIAAGLGCPAQFASRNLLQERAVLAEPSHRGLRSFGPVSPDRKRNDERRV